jgi:hypothetical protein
VQHTLNNIASNHKELVRHTGAPNIQLGRPYKENKASKQHQLSDLVNDSGAADSSQPVVGIIVVSRVAAAAAADGVLDAHAVSGWPAASNNWAAAAAAAVVAAVAATQSLLLLLLLLLCMPVCVVPLAGLAAAAVTACSASAMPSVAAVHAAVKICMPSLLALMMQQ